MNPTYKSRGDRVWVVVDQLFGGIMLQVADSEELARSLVRTALEDATRRVLGGFEVHSLEQVMAASAAKAALDAGDLDGAHAAYMAVFHANHTIEIREELVQTKEDTRAPEHVPGPRPVMVMRRGLA